MKRVVIAFLALGLMFRFSACRQAGEGGPSRFRRGGPPRGFGPGRFRHDQPGPVAV